MLKKRIKFTDYNGVEREEDFYFNLTKAEIMEMEWGITGGLTERINRIISTQDAPEILKIFKDIIFKAYGEKSADGKRFEKKNGELAAAFAETEAYNVLFMELVQDDKAAADFMNAIVPSDVK